jgi:hypothetical protein
MYFNDRTTYNYSSNDETIWDKKEHLKEVAKNYCNKNKIKIDLNKTTYGNLTKEPFITICKSKEWEEAIIKEKKERKERKEREKNLYLKLGYNFLYNGIEDVDFEDIDLE